MYNTPMRIRQKQLCEYLFKAASLHLSMVIRVELFTTIRGHVFSDGWSKWVPARFCPPGAFHYEIEGEKQELPIDRDALIDFDSVEGKGSIKNPAKRINAEFRIEVPDIL